MNRAMLRVRINSEDEDLKRRINKKILQNRKLDELYGRKPKSLKNEIEKAIHQTSKDTKIIK